jgi:hypothetical protein
MTQEDRRLTFIKNEVTDRYLPELDAQVWAARKGAYRYKAVGGLIGGLTIVSAGVAAVTAILSDVSDAITAISAALAALLSAAQQTLAPVDNSRRVRQEAAEWEDMTRDFRHFLNFTLLQESYEEAHRKRFDELLAERGELVRKFVGMSPDQIPSPAKELLAPHRERGWLDRLVWRRRRRSEQPAEHAEPAERGRQDEPGAP